MRDDKWLFAKLDEIWDTYFTDVPQENDVKIIWGRRARRMLGSIKQGEKRLGKQPETIITINALFKDQKIPEFVIDGTIAHELAHYTHGFHSPLEQRHATAHAGGVVTKELKNRGLEKVYRAQKKWLKENWREYLAEKFPSGPTKRRRRRVIIKWI